MTNPLFDGEKPNFNEIRRQFPEHGYGRIRHVTILGDSYSFMIERMDDVRYAIIIEHQPDYRAQQTSLHATHRLPAPAGRFRVCVRQEPADLPTAVTVALWWAECTSRYIRDGNPW